MKKNNHTKYAIMGVIITGCRTGYDIKQFIDQSLNHFWKISYGQIYPTLKLLASKGLATVQDTVQEGKPDKKEYYLTEKGRNALREWLEDPIDEIPFEKNQVLLKVFFSRHQSREKTIKHIESYRVKLQETYHIYKMIAEGITANMAQEEDAQYWLFTLDYGKKVTTAQVTWCDETIQKLKEM